ncbi:MAG: RNA polymerase sigma factor [Bacteroidales bacterium]|nr:RNA polymerase sigma factor [Bacteroidales bacterium]MBR1705832.1 RNA polymerase sigma factor [Bacteroidales bacterium]
MDFFRDPVKRLTTDLHLNTWTTEDELIRDCRRGHRSAQKRVFDLLSPKMMALCLRYVGDRQTAEDLLQEGFITLFSKLDSYSGTGSFEGWARRIFVNTALMYLRRTDALKLSDDISEARGLSSEAATPVQNLGYKELTQLIASLPPDARTVFNLHVVEGYSHKEIADMLGFTEATSRSKLQRARMRLQELIRQQNQR